MKSTILIISIIVSFVQASGQGIEAMGIAKVETKNGILFWSGISINDIVNKSDLIFEGRVLTDSVYLQNPPGEYYTTHRVFVLKQFKGDFKSDTVIVVTLGGRMVHNGFGDGTRTYTKKGDEAVFFVTNSQKVEFGGSDPNAFDPFYGPGVSYVTVCDKKDVVKEVYEPIEAVTGQKYIEVHPNMCATQKQK